MSPVVQKLNTHLEALQVFMQSPVYSGFIEARQREIAEVELEILRTLPISPLDIANINSAHGQIDCLREMLTTFEDTVQNLKDLIDETVEGENNAGTTTKQ